jgi:hypothetical protein
VTTNIDLAMYLYMYVLNFQSGNSGKVNQRMYLDLPELTKKNKQIHDHDAQTILQKM